MTTQRAPQVEDPLMARVAWEYPDGNSGRGSWFPPSEARRFATFYAREGAEGRRVFVEFPDGSREEVNQGEPVR